MKYNLKFYKTIEKSIVFNFVQRLTNKDINVILIIEYKNKRMVNMKKKLLILLTLIFMTPFVIKAEELQMEWQKSWGGNYEDYLNNVIETEDGSIILFGDSNSTDIEGLPNKGSDIILVKYSIEYDLGNVETENGSAELKQEGKYGIITPTPNEGYEVDKIIIKDIDGNILDIETTKREDGTYSFELYTDVSIEVIYKEKIENPKTGIIDIITILIVGFMISISGLFLVKRYNERYEI